ncbi:hypothetical protein DFJ77DRAFT_83281 [Powellomyces hirtus]|nr:hypothetical protein DFJ77DRAFT_83281 [Powellomyces hirtus]
MAYILHLTSGQPAISPPPNREFRTPPSGSPQPFMNNAQQGTGYLQGERNGPPLAGKATVTPGTPSPYAVQQPDSPHLDRRYSTLYQHNGSPLHINVDSSGYGLASPIHQYQSQSQIQSPIEPHPRRPPPSNTGNNDPPPSPQQRFRQPTLINGIAPYEYPISASTPLLHYRSSQPLQSPMGAQPPATFASPRSPTDRRASVSVAECPHSSSPTRLSFGVPEQDHRPSSAGSNGGDRLPSGGFSTVAIPPPPTAAQSPIHRYFTLPPHDFRGTPNQYRRPSHHRSPSADNPSTAYSFNGEPPAFSFPQPLHSRRPSTIEEVDHQKDLIRRASSPLLQAFSGSSIMTDPGSPITSSPNTPQAMHRPLSGDGGGTAPEHRRASTPPRPSPAHITAAQQPQQNHTQPPPSPTAPRQNQWQQHRAHMTPQPLTTADTATAYSPESTSSSSTPPQQHYFIMSPTKTTATAWDRERYVPPPRLPTAPAVALSGVPQRGPSTTITTTPQKPNLNSPASAAPSVRSRRQTILVAIDGSVHADAAFDWACANIVTRGDNVVVARVLEEVDIRQKYLADKANGTHFLELELKEYVRAAGSALSARSWLFFCLLIIFPARLLNRLPSCLTTTSHVCNALRPT